MLKIVPKSIYASGLCTTIYGKTHVGSSDLSSKYYGCDCQHHWQSRHMVKSQGEAGAFLVDRLAS